MHVGDPGERWAFTGLLGRPSSTTAEIHRQHGGAVCPNVIWKIINTDRDIDFAQADRIDQLFIK